MLIVRVHEFDTYLDHKHDDFNFHNVSFLRSNIFIFARLWCVCLVAHKYIVRYTLKAMFKHYEVPFWMFNKLSPSTKYYIKLLAMLHKYTFYQSWPPFPDLSGFHKTCWHVWHIESWPFFFHRLGPVPYWTYIYLYIPIGWDNLLWFLDFESDRPWALLFILK